jgi:hypothetical protein
METIAQSLYAEYYEPLYSAVAAVNSGDLAQALNQVDALLASAPNVLEQPGDVQALFFAEALHKRLDPDVAELGNLYLLPDQGAQIQTFNLMAEKFPVVHFSQEIVNRACLEALQGASDVTILDIGIGTGQQMVRLLEQRFQQGEIPSQVHVIGIEPAEESLKQAEAALLSLAERYSTAIRFTRFQQSAESLNDAEWQQLDSLLTDRSGKLIVNGSFALHHIRPARLRTAIFTRLKQAKPDLLTLIEPYADFLTTDVATRFTHAWHHYGLVFRALDQLDVLTADKNAMKSMFFRREIQDVLSDDAYRVEQFETGEMWISRLKQAGFQLAPLAATEGSLPNCPFVSLVRHEEYLTMDINGYPILSILAAK